MGIYDSLRVTKQNAQAAYRLAEVQFRVLGDLDAALYLYEETFNKGNSTSLKKDAGLGIIDIYIAKNDLLSAEAFCSKIILEEPNILEYQIKAAQILFYKAEFDKTDSELKQIIETKFGLPSYSRSHDPIQNMETVVQRPYPSPNGCVEWGSDGEQDVGGSRLLLARLTADTLVQGLDLLGIKTVERM